MKRKYNRGVLAMANAGPNTNGSQFFFMHADYGRPPNYTIFGQLTSGEDVLDQITGAPTGAQDRPQEPVKMTSINVTESNGHALISTLGSPCRHARTGRYPA